MLIPLSSKSLSQVLSPLNATKQTLSKETALIILFSLTTNDREEINKLRQVFQQYEMQFMRFTTRKKNDLSPIVARFSQNTNFVAWTDKPMSVENRNVLSQILISKVILTAFFYEGQIWPLSRLKKIQKQKVSLQNDYKFLPLNFFWSSLQNLSF